MPKRDEPLICICIEISAQPVRHWTIGGATLRHCVQADKVNVSVIERIVPVGARGDAASFAVGGNRENIEVCETATAVCRISLMISNRRPRRGLPQQRG